METTTRRGILGAIAVAPAVLAATPTAASPSAAFDPVWPDLVADFRAKYAAWLLTIDLEEKADDSFCDACSSLLQEPVQPGSGLPADILDMTIRELKAAGRTPGHKAAWADYERDHAAWKTQRDTLREQVVGPAKATQERAYSARTDAFNALTSYRVTNLHDLGEKIEIIAKDYDGCDLPPEYLADVLADVRQLSGEA